MTGDGLVVSNTSPLLNLALIDRLGLIAEQFSTITIPQQVWDELMAGTEGVEALQSCRDEGTIQIVSTPGTELFVELRRELDAGEAAALAYAARNDAELVLIDERDGRRAARRHDLPVTGVIGILLRAAEDSADLQTDLEDLQEAGFWISADLYERAIERADQQVD